ncbi:hypothetical protein, partial [Listeria monocytogenes]|uniref:hypothetical protein n=1 Tax=Listeria monocytogenes TaxID=1639 RepID=UPI000A1F7C79
KSFIYRNNLQISLWHIKDYLIILFFSVFPIVSYLKKLKFNELILAKKTELISFMAIPLFINSTYTLPVIWEMVLIFIITILSVFIAVANQQEDTKFIAKFFNFILICIGLFMLLIALNQFLKNINDVLSLDFWLSFGIEPLVWILNVPVIYLVREMIFIEKKVIFSQYKNRVYSYMRYFVKLLARKFKFRKYEDSNPSISEYIQEVRELSVIGGKRIYIKLNKKDLSNKILIAIASDAILGRNKFTHINNRREKYPNIVEIINSDNELCVFWQDNFVSTNYRDNRIDKMKTIELTEGIKLIQN